MVSRYFLLCLISSLFFTGVFSLKAQDGSLLIQQYRNGPALTSAYSTWELTFVGLSSFWIPQNKMLSPKLNYLAHLRLLFKPSPSMAFTSGFEYVPIQYDYTQEETLYLDRLVYYSIPLGIRLFPYKRLHLGATIHYSLYQKGNSFWPAKEKTNNLPVAPGVLQNSIGFCASVDYAVWRNWRVEAQFRLTKRSNNLYALQTNSYIGYFIGLSHPLFKSKPNY